MKRILLMNLSQKAVVQLPRKNYLSFCLWCDFLNFNEDFSEGDLRKDSEDFLLFFPTSFKVDRKLCLDLDLMKTICNIQDGFYIKHKNNYASTV